MKNSKKIKFALVFNGVIQSSYTEQQIESFKEDIPYSIDYFLSTGNLIELEEEM